MNMNEFDLSLKLLSGMPIEIENTCDLKPLTLKEIINDYNEYAQNLNLLCLNPSDIKKIIPEITDDITTFDFIISNCFHDENYQKMIEKAFQYFLKEPVYFNKHGFFYIGGIYTTRFISVLNYEEIKKILRKQNCLDYIEQDEVTAADEKTREILEKMKKAEEMVRKIKNGNQVGEPLNLFDLISILAGHGNNISLQNIWDLTMFQFNDAFSRMKMLEEYTVNIQSLLHGADSKKIELIHWISKIKKD